MKTRSGLHFRTGQLMNLKFRALPVQLIEKGNSVIVKRGCTECRITGDHAAETVKLVIAAARKSASRQDICDRFPLPQRQVIGQLIDGLVFRQILVPSENSEDPSSERESSLDIFYWHFQDQESTVAKRLNDKRIAILGVNYISRQLASTLIASGVDNFQIVDYPPLRNIRLFGDDGKLIDGEVSYSLKSPVQYKDWLEKTEVRSLECVVATSDFGASPVMREWNNFCVEHGRVFFPIVLQNLVGYVGPFVIPCETACYECLRARQNSHMEDAEAQRAAESMAFEGQGVVGFHPSMASILGDIAALEMTRFYSEALPKIKVGTLIEVNLVAMKLQSRKVLKIPRCSVCSPLNKSSSTNPEKGAFVRVKRLGK